MRKIVYPGSERALQSAQGRLQFNKNPPDRIYPRIKYNRIKYFKGDKSQKGEILKEKSKKRRNPEEKPKEEP